MRAGLVVELHVFSDEVAEVLLPEEEDVIEQLSTEVPTNRSAKAFMLGARGAVRTIRTPTPSNADTKAPPNFPSRSQTRTRGARSIVALRAC
jgi:hypothetical protein